MTLYAVGKQRGWLTKLVREGVLPWCEQRYRESEKASLYLRLDIHCSLCSNFEQFNLSVTGTKLCRLNKQGRDEKCRLQSTKKSAVVDVDSTFLTKCIVKSITI